jgi:hypothetical protein
MCIRHLTTAVAAQICESKLNDIEQHATELKEKVVCMDCTDAAV